MNPIAQQHVQQLELIYAGKPWYGKSIIEVLEPITWEAAVQPVNKGDKSIANLLLHMLNWRNFALQKLQGNDDFKIELNSVQDWTPNEVQHSEDWEALQTAFSKNQEALIEVIGQKEATFFSQMVPNSKYTFSFLLDGLVQHDLYHLGQISILLQVQK